MGLKQCSQCGDWKPTTQFHRNSQQKSGLHPSCKECRSARFREWYAQPENKAAHNQRAMRWHKGNPAAAAVIWHRYINQPHVREQRRLATGQWVAANRELARARDRARDAVERFTVSPAEILRLYNSPCCICGSTADAELDHIVPLARGGRHSIGNLAPMCASCNRQKGARTLTEYRLWRIRVGLDSDPRRDGHVGDSAVETAGRSGL